jgi:quercetin dioxygenase-like cupin family protein
MDYCVLPGGRKIHHWEVIPMVFWDMPWHRRYQLVQETQERFVLRVIADAEPPRADLEALSSEIRQTLGPEADFRIELVDDLAFAQERQASVVPLGGRRPSSGRRGAGRRQLSGPASERGQASAGRWAEHEVGVLVHGRRRARGPPALQPLSVAENLRPGTRVARRRDFFSIAESTSIGRATNGAAVERLDAKTRENVMTRAEFEADLRQEGYEVREGEIKPNEHREAHAHGFDARVLVLDGSITLVFGKDRVTYGPGDSCSVPAGTMHEEHTDADGVRYVSGRRPVPHEAAARS